MWVLKSFAISQNQYGFGNLILISAFLPKMQVQQLLIVYYQRYHLSPPPCFFIILFAFATPYNIISKILERFTSWSSIKAGISSFSPTLLENILLYISENHLKYSIAALWLSCHQLVAAATIESSLHKIHHMAAEVCVFLPQMLWRLQNRIKKTGCRYGFSLKTAAAFEKVMQTFCTCSALYSLLSESMRSFP